MPILTLQPPNVVLVSLENSNQWVDISADRPRSVPNLVVSTPYSFGPSAPYVLCDPPAGISGDESVVSFLSSPGRCETVSTVSLSFRIELARGPKYVVSAGEPFVIIQIDLSCPADLWRDSGVDINDLLYFLEQYQLGRMTADLDDGSLLGIKNGAVTIEDLLYFLDRFIAGC